MPSDIIQILPDTVANQIAAGEVVQRPASVVKELMENAVDAGASKIQVILKNVGKAIIQVIDNGKGMSPMDARMAFERHATSKISSANDLFNIHTLGFRGEALPSIASVSEIELKTRRAEDELGTCISIAASEVKCQNPVNIPEGTNICVRNLFFNIPARRKFLKSDTTELRNITNEFLRVALTYPEISFALTNNGNDIYTLPVSGLRQRIVNIFGKGINNKLINIDCQTEMLKMEGFICHPQHARKTYGEQYFFVNKRFMKHNFFHKAITEAFSGLIPADSIPSYFLYFTVDPQIIDINIHPTKTEIKFQHETDFFQIIMAGVKEALGKFNVAPSLDFDREGDFGYVDPKSTDNSGSYTPKVDYTPGYNPFRYQSAITPSDSDFEKNSSGRDPYFSRQQAPANWEKLFEGLQEDKEHEQLIIPGLEGTEKEGASGNATFMQLKGRYIITPVRSGLMFIHQKRAHERILFEKYTESLQGEKINGQKSMFPETLELSATEYGLMREIREELEFLGFEIDDFGKNCYVIQATPPDITYSQGKEILIQLLDFYKNTESSIKGKGRERILLSLAKAAAMAYNTPLSAQEMTDLVDSLFACSNHNFTADGKTIVHILDFEEVNGWFK